MVLTPTKTIISLDLGEKHIGVAIASLAARLPSPLTTIDNNTDSIATIKGLIDDHQAVAVVVGLPRGLSGQETRQTGLVREFSKELTKAISVPIHLQDEALTSKQAVAELDGRGVRYNKGAIDALAAVYILNDFLAEHQEFEEV